MDKTAHNSEIERHEFDNSSGTGSGVGVDPEKTINHVTLELDDTMTERSNDLFGIVTTDYILYRKQALIQDALDEIGMTWFHWKVLILNSFGYMADSAIVVMASIVQPQVNLQFNRENDMMPGVSTAMSTGLLAGAVVWGLGADAIGRRLAFNTSLFVCAIFGIIAGAMPTFLSFTAMVAISSAGAGGNYALDSSSLFEFLPSYKAHYVTLMANTWGLGYFISGMFAWAFMSDYSCPDASNCTNANNMGWRYLYYTVGAFMFVLAVLRVVLIRMVQTPKWLITQERDEEAWEILNKIALKYNRPMSLTLEQLTSVGRIDRSEMDQSRFSITRMFKHVRGLFVSKKLIYSNGLLLMIWILIGLGDPLYSIFRPYYLKTRGYQDNTVASNYITWRNYAISNVCVFVGPLLAWPLMNTPYIRRKGTMVISSLLTMVFLFAYTQIKTPTQNLAVSSIISAVENMFFAALYGITPELLPTHSRVTGYGLFVAVNRVCNIIANVIAGVAGVNTVAPLFIAAAMFGGISLCSIILPFEPSTKFVA
ncbi:hypothetical protein AWJ20_2439 [Sugiyamaella lignohabitans]|uniref:Major facilitator superfamily (MFS) profile domain-containing protein n=1 Tax=Sugiyamaella lignohabitans TaxID=796027 RepID=A0A161HMD1_9ASCO|nr:uncharacterized protein AWJ20_2439 [Sugiyamaella lignohabitans]ANB14827.1 hypothetical protein AWJ20_2439 [Sugiyamaella lignohabitans]